MVSFHTPLSIPEFENSSKKRKYWEETENIEEVKPMKPNSTTNSSIFETELQYHQTPLPSEWQRCLDIKSGQIYFYNTRTHKRTSRDPRITSTTPEEPPSHGHMSLDLDLNLPCGSVKNHKVTHNFTMNNSMVSANNKTSNETLFMNSSSKQNKKNESAVGLNRVPSWLAFEGDQREMVTAVCKRCHMLVMMCKSSPSCPNCKFMHPPDQNPPSLFKQRLGLLC